MAREVEFARLDSTMWEIAGLMREKNLGSLPACEGRVSAVEARL
jgi:hypothetical protein